MEKARQEIDFVVGKMRLVEESDIVNLPYLQAIVKETLRLHPTGPVIVRESSKWCTIGDYELNKIFLQTSLERNLSNLSYIFILNVKFENLTIGLHVLIISFMLAKFQEDQKSITMSSNKC